MSAAAAKRLSTFGDECCREACRECADVAAVLEEYERMRDERKRISIEVCAEMVAQGFDEDDAAVMRDFVMSVLAQRKAPKVKR